MKRFIFKRKIWKRIGLSLLSLILTLVVIFGYAWVKYAYVGPFSTEEVHFESLGDRIVGTLTFPDDSDGPFPTVLLLHGSGPLTRHGIPVDVMTKTYLKEGFAVFAYDKRGTGDSGGKYYHSDFENVLADIYNAIDFLQSKPNIRPDAIGLSTNSESGFFAPQIASERPDIAFIYNRVGPVVDYASLSMYQMRHVMKRLHKKAEDVEEIMRIHRDVTDFYIKSDRNPEFFEREKIELSKRMSAAAAKYGVANLPFGSRIGNYNETYVHRRAYSRSYDPRVYFEQSFETQLYYAFGALDINVPTDASVASLEEIMKRNEHNITYKVWPHVDHKMVKIAYVLSGAHPRGYLKKMGSWAREVVDGKCD